MDFSLLTTNSNMTDIDDIRRWLDDSHTKRVCFDDAYLKKCFKDAKDGQSFYFNIPFSNSIRDVFLSLSGFFPIMFDNRFGGKSALVTSEQKSLLEECIRNNYGVVFLRDCLSACFALSLNMSEPGIHTELGELEYQLKYSKDFAVRESARSVLIERFLSFVDSYEFLKSCDYVCCVPSNSKVMIPFAQAIESKFGIKDISNLVNWTNQMPDNGIKNENNPADKLNLLNERGISIAEIDLAGSKILLIDDLYQSGVTMQFTALNFFNRGASSIYGLSLVKALSNK